MNRLLLQVCIQLLAHVKNAGSNPYKAELSSQAFGANRGMFHSQECSSFTLGEKLRNTIFNDWLTHETFVHVALDQHDRRSGCVKHCDMARVVGRSGSYTMRLDDSYAVAKRQQLWSLPALFSLEPSALLSMRLRQRGGDCAVFKGLGKIGRPIFCQEAMRSPGLLATQN